ncbi:hypothetical protein SAMN02927924_00011 [Sphingobium faniae]|nr:hypothetical protein SAMN02927924_00011 [Sphingobium faniae]
MDLDADMMRDQANDALAVRGGQRHAGVADPFAEPIDPQAAVRVQHDLDHGGIVELGRD